MDRGDSREKRARHARGRRIRARVTLTAMPVAIAAIGCLLVSAARPVVGASMEGGWRWAGGGATGEEAPMAAALAPGSGDWAWGDASGVSISGSGRRDRVSLPSVRDLAFDRHERLWIATDFGLYLWEKGARPVRRDLPGGEQANRVSHIAVTESGFVVATEAGAFWSSSGRSFQSLSVGGAFAAADLVAAAQWRAEGAAGSGSSPVSLGRLRVWVLVGSELHQVTGIPTANGLRVIHRDRMPGPRRDLRRQPVDMAVAPGARRLVLVLGDALAWRAEAERGESPGSGAWQIERPVLPPGAVIRRFAWSENQLWLATDHGLLKRRDGQTTFERAAQPLGTSICQDVGAGLGPHGTSGVVALCGRGVYVLDGMHGADGNVPANRNRRVSGIVKDNPSAGLLSDRSIRENDAPLMPRLPPLPALRGRALDLAGLSMSRSQALRRGLSQRAYWPELSFRLDADLDHDEAWDEDQAFISGAQRQLYDQSRDRRRAIGASLEFEWDLGGIAYPSDSVDLSRELRQVLSLRDDISDEINQLYFARRAIAQRLARGDLREGETAEGLTLRVLELEAGLDAWTGGWLTRWRLDQSLLDPAQSFHPVEQSKRKR